MRNGWWCDLRWDKELEFKLKDLPLKIKAMNNLEERIKYLEESKYLIKPINTDSIPASGGITKQEDVLVNKLVEIEELKKNLEFTEKEVEWMKKGLLVLTDIEKEVINKLCLDRVKVRKICEELGYEKSQIYRIKDQAIYKMTIALYGTIYS